MTPSELLTCPEAPALAAALAQGVPGVKQLKAAEYTVSDILGGGLDNVWALAAAGYGLQELRDGGVADVGMLRAAGFGAPSEQPAGMLAAGLRDLARATRVQDLNHITMGTQLDGKMVA